MNEKNFLPPSFPLSSFFSPSSRRISSHWWRIMSAITGVILRLGLGRVAEQLDENMSALRQIKKEGLGSRIGVLFRTLPSFFSSLPQHKAPTPHHSFPSPHTLLTAPKPRNTPNTPPNSRIQVSQTLPLHCPSQDSRLYVVECRVCSVGLQCPARCYMVVVG